MIDLNNINLNAVGEHYMVANTPRYLYKHLRAEPGIQALALTSNPRELLSAISAIERKEDRTADDIALAYAMIVALSFQDYRHVREAIAAWRPSILTWASHLLSIIEQTKIITNTQALEAPQPRSSFERKDIPTTTRIVLAS